MTTFLLVRHAHHAFLGHGLAGRTCDLGLDARGRKQADALVARLAGVALDAIYVSPRRRTRETAAALAVGRGLAPEVLADIDEIDFGDWSGRAFADLSGDPQWALWCSRRSAAHPPGGETIVAVQRRAMAAMEALSTVHPEGTVALVSHGDVIKALLAHCLAMSLDDLERFDIAPASVSAVATTRGAPRVQLLNATAGILAD